MKAAVTLAWIEVWITYSTFEVSTQCLVSTKLCLVNACCCYWYLGANVQRHRCVGTGRVTVSVGKWKRHRNMRREMDACQCWERSPGKAGYGELSLMPTLAVLDSYQRQPTDEQIERHHQLLVTVLCSCCCLPSWASCFTPSCQHNMARAVSLQWDHFLYPATPFQVHLKYLPVP